eukprot:350539-Chlamydomonas_euryale.AAC.2
MDLTRMRVFSACLRPCSAPLTASQARLAAMVHAAQAKLGDMSAMAAMAAPAQHGAKAWLRRCASGMAAPPAVPAGMARQDGCARSRGLCVHAGTVSGTAGVAGTTAGRRGTVSSTTVGRRSSADTTVGRKSSTETTVGRNNSTDTIDGRKSGTGTLSLRRRGTGTASTRVSGYPRDPPPPPLAGGLLIKQCAAMFAASAVLGPLCDGLHSSAGVLRYADPTLTWPIETCWWVPLLFGAAGVIIGAGVPLLDDWVTARRLDEGMQPGMLTYAGRTPAWAAVLICITCFVANYHLSAVLQLDPLPVPHTGDAVLAAFALATWWAFDGSVVGLGMSTLTAVAGPAAEVVLINGLGLYEYAHPEVGGGGVGGTGASG